MLIGEFHLRDNTEKTIIRITEDLHQLGVGKVVPLHCTGENTVRIMCEVFGAGCIRAKEGDVIKL